MNYLVAPNRLKPAAVQYAGLMIRQIEAHGDRALISVDCKECLPSCPVWMGEMLDQAIILGGDGTILRLFHEIKDLSVPIWGVNFGHLGYLTDCEAQEALEKLSCVLEGQARQEQRTLLEGTIEHEGETVFRFTGLNEACVHRGALSRALSLDLRVNDSLVRSFTSDGVIAATATGSTAYNYSAGGPILTPDSGALVLTPICARPSDSVPLVTGGTEKICICVHMPQEISEVGSAYLQVDGYEKYELSEGDKVRISRSERRLTMIRTSNENFYDRLRERLSRA